MKVCSALLRYREDLAYGALRYRKDLALFLLRYREDLAQTTQKSPADVVQQDVVQQDGVFAP